MMTCEQSEQLLLDYLYGLVEGDEARALEEHLRNCRSCTDARYRMERWQKLLATAARDRFPAVHFAPPRFQQLPVARSAVPQMAASQASGSFRWLAWAIAAAIWLTGPLLLLTWESHRQRIQTAHHDWQTNRQTLTELESQLHQQQQQYDRQLAEARRQVASAEQLALGLLDRWLAEHTQLQQSSPMPVEVHGPPRLQAGVPNNLLLVWRDPRLAADGRILAEIRDQNDAVVFQHPLKPEWGERQLLHIPARLWTQVKSHSELFLVLVREDERTRHRSPIQEKIRLQGPVYVTFLTTDRTRYRPGDTVYFRSLTLDRVHFQPPPREQYLVYTLKDSLGRVVSGLTQAGTTSLVRTDSSGQVIPVTGPDGQPLRGVGCGAFVLPSDMPEGEYVLEVSELRHPAGYGPLAVLPARSPLRVERGPQEQLAKRLDFLAPAFAPDSWVEAQAQVQFRGQPLVNCPVDADATVDGLRVPVELIPHGHTDEKGSVQVRFRLPPNQDLKRGDARLRVIFHTPQGPERIAREVPIVGRQVIVEFFPEGGHLVAGVPSRVYFRATTPAGLPVDIRGVITDGRSNLTHVETYRDPGQPGVNRGLGVFTFTPELGRYYWLRLTEPANVSAPLLPEVGVRQITPASAAVAGVAGAVTTLPRGYLLPSPETTGVVLRVPQGQEVTRVGEPIRVQLHAVGKPERRLVVGAFVRGALLDSKEVTVTNGQMKEVTLLDNSQATLGGVVRLTVYEDLSTENAASDLMPMAERLVYRHGGQHLRIQADVQVHQVNPDTLTSHSAPTLSIATYDERGRPVPAILYAAAVNSADAPGPHHRLLTTHFLVAGEIHSPDSLEYADFLLSDHPQAAATLDLVLGTQGWRRFREWQPQERTSAAPEPAALASIPWEQPEWSGTMYTPSLIAPLGKSPEEIRWQLYEKYWPQYEQAMQKCNQARHQLSELQTGSRQQTILQQLHLRVLSQQAALEQMNQQWESAVRAWYPWREARWIILFLGITLMVVCLAAAWVRRRSALPWGVSSVGLLVFFVPGMWLFVEVDHTLMAAAQSGLVSAVERSTPSGQEKSQPQASVPLTASTEQKHLQNDTHSDRVGRSDNLQHMTPPQHPFVARPQPPLSHRQNPSPPASGGNAEAALTVDSGPQDNHPSDRITAPAVSAPAPPPALGSQLLPAIDRDPNKSVKLPPRMEQGIRSVTPSQFSDYDAGNIQTQPKWLNKARIANIPLDPPYLRKDTAGQRGWVADAEKQVPGHAPPVFAAGDAKGSPEDTQQNQKQEIQRRLREQEERKMQRSQELAAAFVNSLARNRVDMVQQGWSLRQNRSEAPSATNATIPGLSDRPPPTGTNAIDSHDKASNRTGVIVEAQLRQLLHSLQLQPPPLVVREYAPPLPADHSHEIADTLLWMPVIVVNDDGKVQLPLVLGKAPGGYDLIVAGHTLNGRLGAIRTSLPLAFPKPDR